MLAITPTAAEAIQTLVSRTDAPEGSGLRIAPQSPDTAGPDAAGQLEVQIASEPVDADEVVEQEGVQVFLDPDVSAFLDDKLLDARVEGDRVGFTLADQAA